MASFFGCGRPQVAGTYQGTMQPSNATGAGAANYNPYNMGLQNPYMSNSGFAQSIPIILELRQSGNVVSGSLKDLATGIVYGQVFANANDRSRLNDVAMTVTDPNTAITQTATTSTGGDRPINTGTGWNTGFTGIQVGCIGRFVGSLNLIGNNGVTSRKANRVNGIMVSDGSRVNSPYSWNFNSVPCNSISIDAARR